MISDERPWLVYLDRQKYGPYSEAQVVELIEAGTVTSEFQVWRLGWTLWKPVFEVFPAPAVAVSIEEKANFSEGLIAYQPKGTKNIAEKTFSHPTQTKGEEFINDLIHDRESRGCCGCGGCLTILIILMIIGSASDRPSYSPRTPEQKIRDHNSRQMYEAAKDLQRNNPNKSHLD